MHQPMAPEYAGHPGVQHLQMAGDMFFLAFLAIEDLGRIHVAVVFGDQIGHVSRRPVTSLLIAQGVRGRLLPGSSASSSPSTKSFIV
jgi:hypothetical protein